MKGSIRSKGKSSWQIQIYTSRGADGKWNRYFETVRGKKAAAQCRLNELLVNLDKGVCIQPGHFTVDDLMDSWLQGSAKLKCTPRTIDGYESIKRVHLSPALGSLLLRELTPSKIQALYAKATEKWSSRSVYYWHRVLSEACKFGVRQGLLVSNPCLLCDPPKVVRKIMRALNPAEAEIIMVAAKDSPFYPVYFTASIPACGKVNY